MASKMSAFLAKHKTKKTTKANLDAVKASDTGMTLELQNQPITEEPLKSEYNEWGDDFEVAPAVAPTLGNRLKVAQVEETPRVEEKKEPITWGTVKAEREETAAKEAVPETPIPDAMEGENAAEGFKTVPVKKAYVPPSQRGIGGARLPALSKGAKIDVQDPQNFPGLRATPSVAEVSPVAKRQPIQLKKVDRKPEVQVAAEEVEAPVAAVEEEEATETEMTIEQLFVGLKKPTRPKIEASPDAVAAKFKGRCKRYAKQLPSREL